MRVLLDEVIHTDYGQFDLIWSLPGGFDGDYRRFFAGQVNGLVGAGDPSGLYLNLARRSGGSPVRIVLHDVEPALADESWEDVVEVSIRVPDGSNVRWCAWAGMAYGELGGLDAGDYRVRVSARGRDLASEEFSPGTLDEYLVELWPAEPGGDRIVRAGSANAAYWHREWGGPERA